MIEDFCQFFRKFEEDPRRKVKVPVLDYLQLVEHLKNCDNCWNIVLKLDAQNPNQEQNIFGEN